MARIDYVEALKAAERYADSLQRQKTETTMEVEAEMLDRRRDFLQLADRVFFESIVEGSDLLPMRYFAVGQLAAQAVGRIHVSMADGQGEGFATGFPGRAQLAPHQQTRTSDQRVGTIGNPDNGCRRWC